MSEIDPELIEALIVFGAFIVMFVVSVLLGWFVGR